MAASVVPVVYDHASKTILRWAILDFESQLKDPAFGPQNNSERVLRISFQLYKALAGNDPTRPFLHKLQDYVNGNAP